MAIAALLRMVGTVIVLKAGPDRHVHAHRIAAATHLFYAGVVGAMSSLTIAFEAPTPAQVLLVSFASGFGIGAAQRSASVPSIAAGQLLLALLPPAAVLLAKGDLVSITTGLFMLLSVPAVLGTVREGHEVIQRSISSADTAGRLAQRMQALAQEDTVTGLLNRAGLGHALLDRVGTLSPGRSLALLWLDLDRFKQINDTLGHQAGDRALIEVARRLRAIAPPGAAVARFGGDEFVIAFDVGENAEIAPVTESLLAGLREPLRGVASRERNDGDHDMRSHELRISASIGVALFPQDAADIDTALQYADLALYNAKVCGRNQAVFHTPAMARAVTVRREMADELREAIVREEFSIYFQPIVDLRTGRIRSFEALARWFHPQRGEISPAEFIPVAEECGAIISLGNWIARRAARNARAWPEDVSLTINLAPSQVRAPGAALAILAALREADLPPSRLEIEITEPVLSDNHTATGAFIDQLAQAGARFTLDDFGTGDSSLARLSRHAFSRIKLDGSLVSANASAPGDAMLAAVAATAKALGLELVAEGVETADQAAAMIALGCTHAQGWHFSRPVPDYVTALLLADERGAIGGEGAIALRRA